jgi:hypothetical protein
LPEITAASAIAALYAAQADATDLLTAGDDAVDEALAVLGVDAMALRVFALEAQASASPDASLAGALVAGFMIAARLS